MPGSGPNVGFDPYPSQLSDYAIPLAVCRFDREQPAGQRYVAIPNVYCRGIQRREGAEPSTARFEYTFDDSDPNSELPSQFDQVWPIGASGDYVVENDDELVVLGLTAAGKTRVLFHGHAQVPQVDVQPAGQSVTFTALGVEARAWDTPIGGAVMRNADAPTSTADNDQVETDLPTRFNPSNDSGGSRPNATPADSDVGGAAVGYPVFLDPFIVRTPDPRTSWTVGKAVRYILGVHNRQDVDPLWVKNPDFTNIDTVLKAKAPKEGAEFFNPGDPTTYDSTDIVIRDYNPTNHAWPEAVAELAGYAGAVVRFELTQDSHDEPVTTLRCRRGDATNIPTKNIYLQDAYEVLDPADSNAQELHLARDASNIANAFVVETDPKRYEVSIVLAPGYTPAVGDESDVNRKTFLLSNLAAEGSTKRQKYRLYVADEAGDGHWDGAAFVSGANVALNLNAILGDPDQAGVRPYVRRLRKPESTLFSKDAAKKPLKATLSISRDYTGDAPAVWDRTGHWQPVHGGWQLLKDRIGIYVSIDDPEQWDIGKYEGANVQNPGDKVRGITSQANPSLTEQNTKRFWLRLTCVIEGDKMIDAPAPRRDASPTQFARTRRIDAKDHFREDIVDESSEYNATAAIIESRDDTERATSHAQSLRAAHEFPPVNGSVVIPWLANGYQLGDRIRKVAGRDVTLETNAGSQNGEAARLPYVVEVDWDFSGEAQRTILHYSDRRTDPQRA